MVHLISPFILIILGVVLKQYFLLIYAIYMMCFIFGCVLSESIEMQRFIMNNKIWMVITVVFCISCKIYTPALNGSMMLILIKVLLYAICSLTSCIVFYNVFRKISFPKVVSYLLSEWGKMSLIIYLLPIFLLPKNFIFPADWTNTMINIFVLFVGMIQCCMSCLIGNLVLKIPGISFIMFGKK